MHALPTRYRGEMFRSETEARWAVYFDVLGITRKYEPRRFEIDGLRYVPDFYLVDYDTYVEVKPVEIEHGGEADRKGRLLSQSLGRVVLLFVGPPRFTIGGTALVPQVLHWDPEYGLSYPWHYVHNLLCHDGDHWQAVQAATMFKGDGPASLQEVYPEVVTLIAVNGMLRREATPSELLDVSRWCNKLGHEAVRAIASRCRQWSVFAKECWDAAAPVEVLR